MQEQQFLQKSKKTNCKNEIQKWVLALLYIWISTNINYIYIYINFTAQNLVPALCCSKSPIKRHLSFPKELEDLAIDTTTLDSATTIARFFPNCDGGSWYVKPKVRSFGKLPMSPSFPWPYRIQWLESMSAHKRSLNLTLNDATSPSIEDRICIHLIQEMGCILPNDAAVQQAGGFLRGCILLSIISLQNLVKCLSSKRGRLWSSKSQSLDLFLAQKRWSRQNSYVVFRVGLSLLLGSRQSLSELKGDRFFKYIHTICDQYDNWG